MSGGQGFIDYSGVGAADSRDESELSEVTSQSSADAPPPRRRGSRSGSSRRSVGAGSRRSGSQRRTAAAAAKDSETSGSETATGGSRTAEEEPSSQSEATAGEESDRSTIRGRGRRDDETGSETASDGFGASEKRRPGRSPLSEGSDMESDGFGAGASDGKGAPMSDATFDSAAPSYDDRAFYWDHIVPLYGNPTFVTRTITEIAQLLSFGVTLTSFNFLLVMAFGRYIAWNVNPRHKYPPRPKVEKDWWNRITGERYSGRLEYYAEFWGYECEQHDVETDDGFVLRLHHLLSAKHRVRGHPVILQHGILCNSVNWVLNEERSIAFWLLEQGYDVWLSNIRTNFKQPHRKYSRWDPRYWAWSFKEIGLYDCPAIVNYVYEVTGSKVAFVGHSQGGGTMFLGLSRGARPEMADKMSCFIAMGPAVYAGPILHTFPFNLMQIFKARQAWSFIFGIREFIPVLSLTQEYIPGWLFGYIAFVVFQFLFNFTDSNWVPRQIPKFFRSVPMPNSSELLFYYMGSFAVRGCIFQEVEGEPWFPKGFPPLAVFWGTADTLCMGEPLIRRIKDHEPNVDLHREVILQGHEHLDMLWHVNVVPDVCVPMREIIEETRAGVEV